MKYYLQLDNDNYILGFEAREDGIEFNPLSVNLAYLDCYKLTDNEVVLDEEKLSLKKAEESRQAELSELKAYLIETSDTANDFVEELLSLDNPVTFITDIIALIKTYKNTYKTILAQRKQARDRIKELEK